MQARAVRGNVLSLEGDISASRLYLPPDADRSVAPSLQLPAFILAIQLLSPSSGQCGIDAVVTHQAGGVRSRLTTATYVSKPELTDAKGMPHIKIPLSIPRNMWTQVALHLVGVLCHVFRLPPIKHVDSLILSGSFKLRRLCAVTDEAAALEKPGGMLLFTLPAYGPPTWKTGGAAGGEPPLDGKENAAVTPPPARATVGGPAAGQPQPQRSSVAQGDASPAAANGSQPSKAPNGVPPGAPPTGPVAIMRFSRDANGNVTFSASNEALEQERRRREALMEAEAAAAEEAARRSREAADADADGPVRDADAPQPPASYADNDAAPLPAWATRVAIVSPSKRSAPRPPPGAEAPAATGSVSFAAAQRFDSVSGGGGMSPLRRQSLGVETIGSYIRLVDPAPTAPATAHSGAYRVGGASAAIRPGLSHRQTARGTRQWR